MDALNLDESSAASNAKEQCLRRKARSPSSKRREVKEGEYFLGVGAKGQANGRIYVFVEDDKSLCYEYRKTTKNIYYCQGCYETERPKTRRAIVRNNDVLVPCDHICQPLQYADIQEEQKFIKEKFASTTTVKEEKFDNDILPSSSIIEPPAMTLLPQDTSIYFKAKLPKMEVSLPAASSSPIPITSKTLIHRQREQTPFIRGGEKKRLGRPRKNTGTPAKKSKPEETLNNSSNASTPVSHLSSSSRQNILYTSKPSSAYLPKIPASKSSFIKSYGTISSTTASSASSTISSITTSSTHIIPSSNILTATIKFYKPSQNFLEKCCEILKMDYNNQAYKFWCDITIDKVTSASKPDKTYTTKESKYHGFECLSLYFSGAEEKAAYIRDKINEHIYVKNTKNTIPVDREAEGRILFSETATESHFQAISKWFNCRIGIFSGGKWKRYGNWAATKADIPILLMEEKDGKYFPILSLK